MNTISAIETVYKGYRFRSRLEARWAMFYDRVGVRWTYEPEPLMVGGEKYLPDFLVDLGDGKKVVHEVKSLHETDRIRPLRVYLAGKVSRDHEWRGEESRFEFGGARAPRAGETLTDTWVDNLRSDVWGGVDFQNVGPFGTSTGHGCVTGAESDELHLAQAYWETPREIVDACLDAISRCDLVCAHINAADAFGTLAELGFARGISKPVSLTFDGALTAQLLRRHGVHKGRTEDRSENQHDLWFLQTMCGGYAPKVDDAAEARAWHGKNIASATAREYRLISMIGNATDAAVMTFGDPVDIINRAQAHQWGVALTQFVRQHKAPAEAVRAHRFDGR